MRRGAAWPAKRRAAGWSAREHKHGCRSQRAVARRGGQGGPDAGCAVVTVSAFVSGIRCPVSGVSVRCPTVPVHVTGVRCGRPERSGVQCPAAGVRASRRPLCPTGMRSRGVAVEPHGWDGRVGVVASDVHDGALSVRGWSLALEAGAGRAEPAQGRRGLGRRRGRWLHWAKPTGRLDACEVRPSGAVDGGDHAAWSLCEASGWVGWPLRAFELHSDLSLRPRHVQSAARLKLATL
jgi:hypothetical protein